MRIFILTLLIIFIGTDVMCQYTKKNREMYAARYGIRVSAGAILAREEIVYIGNLKDEIVHQIQIGKTTPQYNVGFWASKRFGWLFAETNILYTNYGVRFDVTTFKNVGHPLEYLNERFGYIDLQAMGGLTANNFRIAVGPIMHILAHHKSELTSLENSRQKLRKVSYGFSSAIGYDIGKIALTLKYDLAFRTVGDHIYYKYLKSEFFETPDGLTLAIAYSFGKEF
ncbi:MAG: hypothetical protein J5I52_09605 [Saprospiraceae bacterium]|nr:hypothetical protein [Saprospiraceae bacterium]